MNDQRLEHLLHSATSRGAPVADDEETESLRHAYATLGQLLAQQHNQIDEVALVESIFEESRHSSSGISNREAWLAMAALAASILVFVGLAVSQLGTSTKLATVLPNTGPHKIETAKLPEVATTEPEQATAPDALDSSLAWDDPWEDRLEVARDYAAEYRLRGYTRLESTSWSASQALREVEVELESL